MDISKIKSRLTQLQSTTSNKDNFWKPAPGKTQIRIVPYKFNKDNPFVEAFFHYGLGNNKTYLSPVTFGKPDPVEEFSSKLKSTGVKDEWIQGKRLEPKMRTFAPVIVRGKESEGVKFWGFGKLVYQELLGVIADPDYGDITDPMNGRDILVEFTPAEGPGQFPKTAIRVKPNVTPMTEDKNVAENVAKNQPNLDDIFKEPSYDDLKEALENWLNPDSEATETSSTTEVEEKKEEAPAGVKKVDDVSAAFDELFNE